MSAVDIDDAELAAMMAELEGGGEPPAAATAPEPEPQKSEPEKLSDDELTEALEAKQPAPEPEPEPSPGQFADAEVLSVPEAAKPNVTTSSYETATADFVDPEQLKKDVRIDPTDLDNAMIHHSSLYVHYAMQTVKARRQFDRTKNAFEILCARLDAEHREELAAGGKKVTEALVENSIKSDARWSAGQSKVIEAQSNWRLAEIAENAFHQRKDLLLELARDRRKEREGQMRVLEQNQSRESVLKMLSAERRQTA